MDNSLAVIDEFDSSRKSPQPVNEQASQFFKRGKTLYLV